MFLKLPENTKEIHWTRHIKDKMRQYQLSEKRVLRVLRKPERKEVGVAPKTLAAMQKAGTKKHPYEVWIMFQKKRNKTKMISAWKYPGISPVREGPPIPEDILENLEDILKE